MFAHPSTRPPASLQGRLWLLAKVLWWPVRTVVSPLWKAAVLWTEAEGLRMSAAMSFYGILSLAPLLVLIVAIFGWWVDRNLLETSLVTQIQAVVGDRGAEVVRQAMESAQRPAEGLRASIIATLLLVVGATGVFAELESAMERMWLQGRKPPETPWWHTASLRLRGVAYVLAIGFLLLVSLVVTTAFHMIEMQIARWHLLAPLLRLGNESLSFLFTVLLFSGLMRMSSGPKPPLRYLVTGACLGALLFAVGKHVLAFYLSNTAVVSAYGAAGSLVVVLVWIYFSSAVLLFSAGCAQALAEEAKLVHANSNTNTSVHHA
ncbi:YihY/virulence factor BrkB family protein [Xylophilus sp. GOD-11R]|uniref:YihY/virulence factor BrkB family protein n=1 Tax=Xylophilus sp. GOD-11R TaxID=3089814 RepID=UPI00298C3697|nr:YihY/virulence factor BrkB family protein [Xylophilus sp. GOD-11R]WPB57120.1 YihY/virulence factor BrkB family protein [Xylophilus sp. GOD-11R]